MIATSVARALQPNDVCRVDGYIFAVPGADEAWMNSGDPLDDAPQISWRVTGDPGL